MSDALGYLTRAFPSDDPEYKKAEAVDNPIKVIPVEQTLQKKNMLGVWKIEKRLFNVICKTFVQIDIKAMH